MLKILINYKCLERRNKVLRKKDIVFIDNLLIKWYILKCMYGRLAQLVRAPALQAGGHRFESYIAHHYYAEIAQLVEQLICNQ